MRLIEVIKSRDSTTQKNNKYFFFNFAFLKSVIPKTTFWKDQIERTIELVGF